MKKINGDRNGEQLCRKCYAVQLPDEFTQFIADVQEVRDGALVKHDAEHGCIGKLKPGIIKPVRVIAKQQECRCGEIIINRCFPGNAFADYQKAEHDR